MGKNFLSDLIELMPSLSKHHAPDDGLHQLLKKMARKEAEEVFGTSYRSQPVEFGPFGKIILPYHPMGTTSSVNLFDLDELIIFGFYWANRQRYKKVADIGANLGLHSIVLGRCGFKVRSFEPDLKHYEILKKNLMLNKCVNTQVKNMAVSSEAGEKEFIRVLGNTTGSHLAGSKKNPYGQLERFWVKTQPIRDIMSWADLLKIDVEGHEKDILLATQKSDWQSTDAIVEVQSPQNARAIFKHFKRIRINLFSQKTNWQKVSTLQDMPNGYREGSLFISRHTKIDFGKV